ncbi:hypothetical protein Z950_2805 [Sulfitobacter mediterraneus KCTC 32188]|nr:hypothetical protein Z950_2805 [Sulfitobacter mediterraneus KCTC 32188]
MASCRAALRAKQSLLKALQQYLTLEFARRISTGPLQLVAAGLSV